MKSEELEQLWKASVLRVISSGYGSLQHPGILSEHAIEVADAITTAYQARQKGTFSLAVVVYHNQAVELQKGENKDYE